MVQQNKEKGQQLPDMSELQGQMMIVDLKIRNFVRKTMRRIQEIENKLYSKNSENLTEKERQNLLSMRYILRENIQKIRFAGLINDYKEFSNI